VTLVIFVAGLVDYYIQLVESTKYLRAGNAIAPFFPLAPGSGLTYGRVGGGLGARPGGLWPRQVYTHTHATTAYRNKGRIIFT
jgi:hypothetical protein